MEIEKYISERVDNQINWYDVKSKKAQKCYKIFQIIEIVLAAFIPLLAGYSSKHSLIPIIMGSFGSVIAIIEAITKLYKFHENWIQYRATCELLRYQKYLYLTNSYPYNDKDETRDNIFIKNIENIISAENNQWKNINTNGKDKNTPPTN
ncbi:DUF4231 domain-containing protein [[Clostridium] symbiosum]|uniref:DUF4231 domain-containing protein n=1 Tax=Clostridium symbiosum TaxID=1512 RepID=UPI0018A0F4DB|nr:DUF4231 domain-containing protein [[Clostridium] symbiosum]